MSRRIFSYILICKKKKKKKRDDQREVNYVHLAKEKNILMKTKAHSITALEREEKQNLKKEPEVKDKVTVCI